MQHKSVFSLVFVGALTSLAMAPTRAWADPEPLVPVIEAFPTNGQAPLTVVFTGRNSTGKWGSAASIDTWEWDFDYDGETFRPDPSLIQDATVSFTYDRPGTYRCRLRVTDSPNVGGPREAFEEVTIMVTASTRDPGQTSEYPPGVPGAGINDVWAKQEERDAAGDLLRPVDQIFMHWSDVEPDQQGQYDWSRLDDRLAKAADAGHWASVQINAPPPAWVFEHIAQTGEARSMPSPQFWDPDYIEWYEALITALAEHIAESPYADRVLYVRQQWNAVHTETTYYDATTSGDATGTWIGNPNWVWPEDGHRYEVEWSEDVAQDYERRIITHFLELFGPLGIGVTLRTISCHLPESEWLAWHEQDPAAWVLQTNNVYRKWDGGVAHMYEFLIMRGLGSLGFEETWGDAELRIPAKNPDLSPEQDIYGIVLRSLQIGLPYIGLYGSDLAPAADNEEFRAVFGFGDRYAGWHLYPRSAPGAWIVLGRFEGETQWRRLQTLTQDNWGYFLRQKSPSETSTPVELVGDASCRFGLMGRRLDDQTAFDLDDGFAESVAGGSVTLEVTYLASSGELEVRVARDGELESLPESDSREHKGWHTGVYQVESAGFGSGPGQEDDILLVPISGQPVVHLIEVLRGSGGPGPDHRDGGIDGGGADGGSGDGGSSSHGSSGCGCRAGSLGYGGGLGANHTIQLLLLLGVFTLLRRRRRRRRRRRW